MGLFITATAYPVHAHEDSIHFYNSRFVFKAVCTLWHRLLYMHKYPVFIARVFIVRIAARSAALNTSNRFYVIHALYRGICRLISGVSSIN